MGWGFTGASEKQKAPPGGGAFEKTSGRGDWIRTSDFSVPNRALYHAEPRPDSPNSLTQARLGNLIFMPAGPRATPRAFLLFSLR